MGFVRFLVVIVVFLLLPLAAVVAGIMIVRRGSAPAPRLMGLALLVAGALALGAIALAMAGVVRDPMSLVLLLPLWTALAVLLIFWAWMLADCALNEPRDSLDKLTWVLIIIFTSVIGGALYYFARRPRRIAEAEGGSPG